MGRRVTIPEAVEITGLKEYSLRKGIKEGRYPHIRTSIGRGKILIDIELLERCLEAEALNSIHQADFEKVVGYGQLRVIKA